MVSLTPFTYYYFYHYFYLASTFLNTGLKQIFYTLRLLLYIQGSETDQVFPTCFNLEHFVVCPHDVAIVYLPPADCRIQLFNNSYSLTKNSLHIVKYIHYGPFFTGHPVCSRTILKASTQTERQEPKWRWRVNQSAPGVVNWRCSSAGSCGGSSQQGHTGEK